MFSWLQPGRHDEEGGRGDALQVSILPAEDSVHQRQSHLLYSQSLMQEKSISNIYLNKNNIYT